MNRAVRIENILKKNILNISNFQLIDESHLHGSSSPGAESHFQLLIVSEDFGGKNRIQRHQWVFKILDGEFQTGLHALSLRLLTPEESLSQSDSFQSPTCHSKKRENLPGK